MIWFTVVIFFVCWLPLNLANIYVTYLYTQKVTTNQGSDPDGSYKDPCPTFEKNPDQIRPSRKKSVPDPTLEKKTVPDPNFKNKNRIRILYNFTELKSSFTFFFRHKCIYEWYFSNVCSLWSINNARKAQS